VVQKKGRRSATSPAINLDQLPKTKEKWEETARATEKLASRFSISSTGPCFVKEDRRVLRERRFRETEVSQLFATQDLTAREGTGSPRKRTTDTGHKS